MFFIPQAVRRIYGHNSFWEKCYVYLRWRLCPFARIEQEVPTQGTIIDIGCGRGMLANYLAIKAPGRNVIGIDLNPERISSCLKTLGAQTNIRFMCADINQTDLPQAHCVIMSDALHHIPVPQQEVLLKEIYQKLEPQGLFILQEVAEKPKMKYWFTYGVDYCLNLGKNLHYRKVCEFKNSLENAGFKVALKAIHQGYPVADILFIAKKEEQL